MGEPQQKRLRIAVEPHQEIPIKWVLDDGRIVYSPAKLQADQLFEVVKRLDFQKRGEEILKEAEQHSTDDDEALENGKPRKGAAAGAWVWQSVWENLDKARSEADLTADLLALIVDAKYMAIDAGYVKKPPYQATSRPHETALCLTTKRSQLRGAASTLQRASERLGIAVQGEADRYLEVRELQRRWRLRPTPHGLLLDLTYVTAGSTHSPLAAGLPVHVGDKSVRIALPGTLQPTRAIGVSFTSAHDVTPGIVPRALVRAGRLAQAQHTLFCTELVSGLGRDAAVPRGIHARMADDVLAVDLRGGRHVYIGMRPINSPAAISAPPTLDALDAPPPVYQTVACMRLHQALRRQHRRRMQARHSGIADRVRAGPAGEDSIGNGDEDGDAPLSMLHTWATHVMVRQRVASDLGIMAVGVNEPRVAVHWSSPGACVSTADVTVRVGGAGQETLLLTVDGAEVTALSMHGRRDVLSEAAVPAYVMQHIASAMVRALTQTALARGWRVVRRHGLSIAVQRRLTLVKVNVKPSLQPFAIAVVVEVDTQASAAGNIAVHWAAVPGADTVAKLNVILTHFE